MNDNRSLEEIQEDMARWRQRNYDIDLVDYINELSETAQTPRIEAMQRLTEDINQQIRQTFNANFDQNWVTRVAQDSDFHAMQIYCKYRLANNCSQYENKIKCTKDNCREFCSYMK